MKKIYSILTLCMLVSITLKGQINTDSVFNSAIGDARNGRYDTALTKADGLLQLLPTRDDIVVFAANVHAWKKDFPTALQYIDKAYGINPKSTELYDAWLNILLWSGNYLKLIEVADKAQQNNYPNQVNLAYKKAIAYKSMGDYAAGIKQIEADKAYLDSVPIKQLYIDLQRQNKSGMVSVFYGIDFFNRSNTDPQHLAYVDYAIKIKKHTLIPRLNYAHRFEQNDFQLEADYYHILNNRQYLYANFGMGINRTLFPEYRAGLEYYFPVFKATEASVGGRYFKSDSTNVYIVTANLNTYYKNMWFMIRPSYIINETRNAFTAAFTTRYYEKNPINYWSLELMYGNSPDERYSIVQSAEQLLLNTYRIRLEKNIAIVNFHELRFSAGYAYEEFIPDNFRSRFTFELLLKIKI